MQGTLDYDPVYGLYEALDQALNFFIKHDKNKDMPKSPFLSRNGALDHLLECILLNNGCRYTTTGGAEFVYNITDNYKIHIVAHMKGNDVNEFFDFVMFNGSKHLIIFIDYFKDIITAEELGNLEPDNIKVLMGNSFAIDAIVKIVDVFYATYSPAFSIINATAMGMTQRKNGIIIAIHLMEQYKPVDENDISTIPLNEIRQIAEGNIKLQLYGIKSTI